MLSPEQTAEMKRIVWAHRIDLGDGVVTPGYYQHTADQASSYFGMPADLTGKTVLDIGCSDGMFSFEAERRGGLVTAMDTGKHRDLCIGKPEDWPRGFQFAKALLGAQLRFWDFDLYDLPDLEAHPQWDVVLFYGVLYHLTRPIDGLAALAAVTREQALIETTYSIGNGGPSWEFRPGHHGDPTNQWYPSMEGLERALHHVGFRRMEVVGHWEHLERMTVRASK